MTQTNERGPKHSPWPWRLYREYRDAITVVDAKVGYRIADVLRYKEATRQESDANTMLIVTAPELLEALRIAETLIARDIVRDDARCLDRIRGAIAKAEGNLKWR